MSLSFQSRTSTRLQPRSILFFLLLPPRILQNLLPPPHLHLPRALFPKLHKHNHVSLAPQARLLELEPRLLQTQHRASIAHEIVAQTQRADVLVLPRRTRVLLDEAPQRLSPPRDLLCGHRVPVVGVVEVPRREIEQQELRREEDDLAAAAHLNPRARRLPLGRRVFALVARRLDARVARLAHGHEVDVHLRAEPLRHVRRRDPVREGDQAGRVELRARALLRKPRAELRLARVNGVAPGQARPGGDFDEGGRRGAGPVAREQDAGLFEELADRARPVCNAVGVARYTGGREGPIAGGEVAAREDVRGGEGGGGADAVCKKDAVVWGHEDYAA